jgi:hypothetical protein
MNEPKIVQLRLAGLAAGSLCECAVPCLGQVRGTLDEELLEREILVAVGCVESCRGAGDLNLEPPMAVLDDDDGTGLLFFILPPTEAPERDHLPASERSQSLGNSQYRMRGACQRGSSRLGQRARALRKARFRQAAACITGPRSAATTEDHSRGRRAARLPAQQSRLTRPRRWRIKRAIQLLGFLQGTQPFYCQRSVDAMVLTDATATEGEGMKVKTSF